MHLRCRASLRPFALLAAALVGASAHAIIGGTPDAAGSVYQYVGTFTRPNADAYLGTPIAPNWFVTAAHDLPDIGDSYVNADGSYTITNVVNVPNGLNNGTSSDIALVQVSGTFTNYYGYGNVTNAGTPVSIIGSGAHSSGIGSAPGAYGRYIATNSIDYLQDSTIPQYNEEVETYLYDLDDGTAAHNVLGSATPTALEGGIADHDSGGSWFVSGAGALPVVVAISSGVASQFAATGTGSTNYYDAGGLGFGADLGYYSSFISQTVGVGPVTIAATPEPTTYAAFGFGVLAFLRRRRRS